MGSAIFVVTPTMKNVPSLQEECVNVKQAHFKHTFKEPTAVVIKVFFV